MLTIFFFSSLFISYVFGGYEHVKEIGFKFWLDPGVEECYYEELEKGSTLYFMYELLNPHPNTDAVIAYFRHGHNESILVISQSHDRGHLAYSTNETMLIKICISHEKAYSYVKYLSVFFHVYYVEKVLEKLKNIEEFDNSSINAQNALSSIIHNIILSREHQMEVRMLDQRDLYLVEKNLLWINRWALIHIFILFSCFLFQTFFIKRLFKTSRK